MRTMIFIVAFILFSVSANAARWELYFANKLGDRFYIDAASIQRTPEGTILVWRKITPADDAKKKVTIEILHEIDCSRRKYRVLQGTIYSDSIKSYEKTDWEYFTPDDLSKALFAAVCKGKFIK
jgi:Surface-adhesin protein E